jgi:hypothetical protein
VVGIANFVVYSKIGGESVVVVKAWRTHERQRVGGSQRSEGHGYGWADGNHRDSWFYHNDSKGTCTT